MKFLDDFSIRTKIIGGFVVVLFLLLVLGFLSITRIQLMDRHASEIRNNWMPSVSIDGDMQAHYNLIRVRQSRILLDLTDEARQKSKASFDEIIQKLIVARQAYEPMIVRGTDDERIIKEFDTVLAHVLEQMHASTEAALKGDREKAVEIFYQGQKYFIQGNALLAEQKKFNVDNGKREADEGSAVYRDTVILVAVTLALGTFLSAFACWVLIRSISVPVKNITDTMLKLADHDLSVAIPGLGRQDEIGSMAGAVEVFKSGLIEADRLKLALEADNAARDERARRIETYSREFEQAVNHALDSLTRSAGDMRLTATTMSGAADLTSQTASTVASAAEQATANVQTVAAASEELSASIAEISRSVAQSTDIAHQATNDIAHTTGIMRSLSEAADRIGAVVTLINSIAGQTNLLALNATIEAARAGDAGKGFTVVASEVKNLAAQTARATDEIAGQISAMQTVTRDAVTAIDRISGTIHKMTEISTTIASAIEQQGAATKEIARNVQEAAQGTESVSQNIQSVNRSASETGDAAGQVLTAADGLGSQANILRQNVEQYLKNVKTA